MRRKGRKRRERVSVASRTRRKGLKGSGTNLSLNLVTVVVEDEEEGGESSEKRGRKEGKRISRCSKGREWKREEEEENSPSHHSSDLLNSKLERTISTEEDSPSRSSLLGLPGSLSGSEGGSDGPSDGSPQDLGEGDGGLGVGDIEDTES